MRPSIFSGLFFVSTLAATALAGCSADESSTGQGEDDYTARGAKQGETCANGVFGTPNIPCADGLECVFEGGSNAPAGPSGSSSAKTGTCQPTGAKQGEMCANGVFGTPNIPCASGLECVFEGGSNAPAGPSGSSSAKTGTCQPAGAGEGEMCANGVFGTPNIPCAEGLECKFEGGSSAPAGPSGSSSAKTGTCVKAGAGEGEMCANGVFGTPNIPCADGLVCKFPNGSSAPTGPSGSSSASTGTCAKP